MIRHAFTAIALLALSVISPHLTAAPEWVSGTVERLLLHNELYGKCMILVRSSLPSNGCPGVWISLDCEGNHLSKQDAGRMWDSVQLAYALDKTLDIYLDDSRKNNGYCVASRLDVR